MTGISGSRRPVPSLCSSSMRLVATPMPPFYFNHFQHITGTELQANPTTLADYCFFSAFRWMAPIKQASIQFPQPSQISLLRLTPSPFRFVSAPSGKALIYGGSIQACRQFEHKEFLFRRESGYQFCCFLKMWYHTRFLHRPSYRNRNLCNGPDLRPLTFLLLFLLRFLFLKVCISSLYNLVSE